MPDLRERLLPKLRELAQQFEGYDLALSDPDVAQDPERLKDLSIRRAALEPTVRQWRVYERLMAQVSEHRTIIAERADRELVELANAELPELEREAAAVLEAMASELVTAEDAQVASVMLEVRAASGGAEAALWAGDLLGMYERYAQQRGWRFEPLSQSEGEAGGLRQAIVQVSGAGVWQRWGYEGGVHCVKRVPATETQGRVHTSTATVAVMPEPRDVEIDLKESDVDQHITTSQGPGGQNVNKVATAVNLLHRPTGIEVRMQESKSQQQNRQKAWALLRARLYDHYQQQAHAQRAAQRSSMIGSGARSERIRTYRYKDNIAVDHRLNAAFALTPLLAGMMDEMIDGLIAMDRAQRIAAL